MKLSFSTRGWNGYEWQDFVSAAEELGFEGIELNSFSGTALTEKNGPFHKYNSASTLRTKGNTLVKKRSQR